MQQFQFLMVIDCQQSFGKRNWYKKFIGFQKLSLPAFQIVPLL
jgi:hypothetical protein